MPLASCSICHKRLYEQMNKSDLLEHEQIVIKENFFYKILEIVEGMWQQQIRYLLLPTYSFFKIIRGTLGYTDIQKQNVRNFHESEYFQSSL